MSGLNQLLHSLTDAVAMPMWLAGAVAALAIFGSVLAFGRVTPTGRIGLAWRIALVMVGIGLLWVLVDSQGGREQAAARRSLDARTAELTLRAIVPGSPLACLDAVASPQVEDACEKALFATPEMVAAAVAYIDARLAILADGLDLAARDRVYAASIERQRRALESDRYGLVAHVFASRGCTVNDCDALKLLRHAHRVIANLHERQFDANVVLYASAWRPDGQGPSPASAVATVPGPAVAAAPNAATTGSATSKIDFPSAASIPAISIMNAEPPLPPGDAAALGPPLPNVAPVAKPPTPRRQTAGDASPPLPPTPPRQPPPQAPPPQQVQQAPQPPPAPPPAPSIPRWGGGG